MALGKRKRVQQPPLEGPARRRLPRQLHRLDDLGTDEDVALDRVAGAGHPARPVEALRPGVGGGVAVDVDDADLPVLAAGVLLDQPLQGDRCGGALVHVGEREALVGDVGLGLGGDRADAGDRGREVLAGAGFGAP